MQILTPTTHYSWFKQAIWKNWKMVAGQVHIQDLQLDQNCATLTLLQLCIFLIFRHILVIYV